MRKRKKRSERRKLGRQQLLRKQFLIGKGPVSVTMRKYFLEGNKQKRK